MHKIIFKSEMTFFKSGRPQHEDDDTEDFLTVSSSERTNWRIRPDNRSQSAVCRFSRRWISQIHRSNLSKSDTSLSALLIGCSIWGSLTWNLKYQAYLTSKNEEAPTQPGAVKQSYCHLTVDQCLDKQPIRTKLWIELRPPRLVQGPHHTQSLV